MNWHRVHVGDLSAQRWRNGGGATRELIAWPVPDDWTVRVSIAEIDRSGPFSAYPGVDRWFAVLSGAGVVLDGRSYRAGDDLLQFAGESAPDCRLIDGPTQDFNLMHRRGRGRMRVLPATAETLQAEAIWLGLFTANGGELSDRAGSCLLKPGELSWCEAGALLECRFRAQSAAPGNWWLVLEAH